MKFSPARSIKIAVGATVLALVAGPGTAFLHAGSAVAADEHGGFGYAYGDYSQEYLRAKAMQSCRAKSEYPADVHIIVASRRRGAGIILRYRLDDRRHIYAYVGAGSERLASDYASGYVEGYGGRQIEVVARWQDGN